MIGWSSDGDRHTMGSALWPTARRYARLGPPCPLRSGHGTPEPEQVLTTHRSTSGRTPDREVKLDARRKLHALWHPLERFPFDPLKEIFDLECSNVDDEPLKNVDPKAHSVPNAY